MKKILVIGMSAALFWVSCRRDSEDSIFEISKVGIDSVKIPSDTMNLYSAQRITTYSQYKDNCEGFYGYSYNASSAREGRFEAYQFKTKDLCGSSSTVASQINFAPQDKGTYRLKFWKNDTVWIEKTIIVQ